MRPKKLSSTVLLETPPVLSAYLHAGRNVWVEAVPAQGAFRVLDRPGLFIDLEALAAERQYIIRELGIERARAMLYRTGFDIGRREASRHYSAYSENGRLALQAGVVFPQVQGRFRADTVRFEFDLGANTLLREVVAHSCAEAQAHRTVEGAGNLCMCWHTAGYLAGHVSEILQRRVVTIERECVVRGDPVCRFISRLEHEWDSEADWAREAFVTKPLAAAHGPAGRHSMALRSETGQPTHSGLAALVAEAPCMGPAMRTARLVARSTAPVLLVGESGTGRRTFARAIHASGPREDGPFECVDGRGAAEELLRRHLLGYEEGAFPGANAACTGAIDAAAGGTLYITEVVDLSARTQGDLLQILREGTVRRVGGTAPAPVDVRLIAATALDPREMVAEGRLREDLYYALAVATIEMPPLRERGDEVLRLAELFLREFRARYQCAGAHFTEDCKQALVDCSWPGNIRQLAHAVEHALVVGEGRRLTAADLPEEILACRAHKAPHRLDDQVIRATLRRARGNRSHAAELLGVSRTTLWRAMKRFGIEHDDKSTSSV